MFKRATPKLEDASFAGLPMRTFNTGAAGTALVVHIAGTLGDDTVPVVCIPGYLRTMLDFAGLPQTVNRLPETGFAFILVDLPGRGRSESLPDNIPYSTPDDADRVLDLLDALDLSQAVLVGEGHGGQVAMLVARKRPGAVAGTVLIDSGPVTDSRSLVRQRSNFQHLDGLRGEEVVRRALRTIVAADYPGEAEARLDQFSSRNYAIDPRGRIAPLFDRRLVAQLEQFDFDDALEPQWKLFDCLHHAPLMLVRTQLSDQLRRATFTEMIRRRPDAATLTISGQGSPALFEEGEERDALALFLRGVCHPLPAEAEEA
ncbi:alpha/beta fold hydrolase [Pelagibacterium lacus]|uniref:Alpha/beta hydrolase n=1 Tax=Pelagibacterium lacus TaxID=2282655 RepID=A0A369W2V5_9HYPH|nr:alpha/beta hydrolase [Pelagibacterium lacus]RDE09004.1 alpha/beta hydrolase [Pelagibacterium lacus]